MNTYPFSIYKRADRPYFLVSFKNADGKFLAGISTKKKTKDEAMAVAFQWLRDGIPQKNEAFQTHELILKDAVRKIQTNTVYTNAIVKRRSNVLTCIGSHFLTTVVWVKYPQSI